MRGKAVTNKLIVICILFLLSIIGVNAEEPYYINNNGVSLTESEYNHLVEMYDENYLTNMTQEEYDLFSDGGYFNKKIEKEILYDTESPITRGTYHSTANKSIQISKNCNTYCIIGISVNWINNPTIRSYDVIGAYLYNVSAIGTVTTRASSTSGLNYASVTNKTSTGVGASVKLPSGSNVSLYQTFTTGKGGTIAASYQHAMSNTTLSISNQYTISRTGYGGVFAFYGSATSVYDNMNGVEISV